MTDKIEVQEVDLNSLKKEDLIGIIQQNKNSSKQYEEILKNNNRLIHDMQVNFDEAMQQAIKKNKGLMDLVQAQNNKSNREKEGMRQIVTGLMLLLNDSNDIPQEHQGSTPQEGEN